MKSLILALTACATCTVGTAQARAMCADRDKVVASLSDRYSERHLASGLQSAFGLMEIWVSESDRTWTILLTQPDGQTCVMASGTHWLEQNVMPVAGEPA